MSHSKFISILFSIFIALSASGKANIFEVKLSIIFGLIIFLTLILFKRKDLKTPLKIDLFVILILLFSVAYAFLIDAFHYKDSSYILITKSFILIFSYTTMRYFATQSNEYISDILLRSNLIIFVINLIIFYLSLNPSLSHLVNEYSGFGSRLKGFDEQTNGYALMLIFNVSIAFFSLIKRKSIINIVALILSLVLSIMTQSRGLLISIFFSILLTYLSLFFITKKFKDLRKFVAILFSSLLIISAIMTYLPTFLYNNYGVQLSRYNDESDTSVKDLNTSSISSERFVLYKSGIETLIKYPFGIGYIDNHITISKTTGVGFVPHNLYIQILLNYGLIFGFVWILILIYSLYKLIVRIKYIINEIDRKLFIFFIMMNIQLLLFFFAHSSETIYMWFFIGLSISFARSIQTSKSCPQ